MRAIITYFALIAAFVWLAADGGFVRTERGALPISNSRAPTHFADLPLPAPDRLGDIRVVPAARAAARDAPTTVYVTGSLVNLRAGPGLEHRMITVAERGEALAVAGAEERGWLPVRERATGAEAWVSSDYISATPPAR